MRGLSLKSALLLLLATVLLQLDVGQRLVTEGRSLNTVSRQKKSGGTLSVREEEELKAEASHEHAKRPPPMTYYKLRFRTTARLPAPANDMPFLKINGLLDPRTNQSLIGEHKKGANPKGRKPFLKKFGGIRKYNMRFITRPPNESPTGLLNIVKEDVSSGGFWNVLTQLFKLLGNKDSGSSSLNANTAEVELLKIKIPALWNPKHVQWVGTLFPNESWVGINTFNGPTMRGPNPTEPSQQSNGMVLNVSSENRKKEEALVSPGSKEPSATLPSRVPSTASGIVVPSAYESTLNSSESRTTGYIPQEKTTSIPTTADTSDTDYFYVGLSAPPKEMQIPASRRLANRIPSAEKKIRSPSKANFLDGRIHAKKFDDYQSLMDFLNDILNTE